MRERKREKARARQRERERDREPYMCVYTYDTSTHTHKSVHSLLLTKIQTDADFGFYLFKKKYLCVIYDIYIYYCV